MIQLRLFSNVLRKGMLAPLAAATAALLLTLPAVGYALGDDDDAMTFTMAEVNDQIGAAHLHQHGVTGAGITVAVIDTGVEPVPGLDGAGKIVVGPDLSFESGLEEFYGRDTYGHGTVMASIIAGDDGTEDGFRGVAPGAQILAVKVADNSGAVDVSQVIAAIDWVIAHKDAAGMNVRVLNLSYSTDSTQDYEIDPLTAAVERAWQAGIVVVVSAGNQGDDGKFSSLANPAIDPYAVVVAAVGEDFDGTTTEFSSVGDKNRRHPDISAPGDRVLGLAAPDSRLVQENQGAFIDGRFLRGSGTSQAAAITSGAVALLLEERPELTPDQVKALLILSADSYEKNTGLVIAAEDTSVMEFLDPELDDFAAADEADARHEHQVAKQEENDAPGRAAEKKAAAEAAKNARDEAKNNLEKDLPGKRDKVKKLKESIDDLSEDLAVAELESEELSLLAQQAAESSATLALDADDAAVVASELADAAELLRLAYDAAIAAEETAKAVDDELNTDESDAAKTAAEAETDVAKTAYEDAAKAHEDAAKESEEAVDDAVKAGEEAADAEADAADAAQAVIDAQAALDAAVAGIAETEDLVAEAEVEYPIAAAETEAALIAAEAEADAAEEMISITKTRAEKAAERLEAAEAWLAAKPGRRQNTVSTFSSSWKGKKLGDIAFDQAAGAGRLNIKRAARYRTVELVQQHELADGSGSLEAARGSSHVTMPDGTTLEGEVTFTGSSWSSPVWDGSSWSGSSWSGSSWSGSSWSGSSWSGSSWSGSSWSGSSWSGSSWSGSSWSGSSWSGSSWSGSSWSGSSWSGSSWSGSSWS